MKMFWGFLACIIAGLVLVILIFANAPTIAVRVSLAIYGLIAITMLIKLAWEIEKNG